jgi:hypothetical protein
MEWMLKLPADADRTTVFKDVKAFDNYQKPEFGHVDDKRRFGLTQSDKRKVGKNPPKRKEKVLIRFSSAARPGYKHIVFAEGIVDEYYSKPPLPPVENDRDIVAVIELKNVEKWPINEHQECMKRLGQPRLLTPLDEVFKASNQK